MPIQKATGKQRFSKTFGFVKKEHCQESAEKIQELLSYFMKLLKCSKKNADFFLDAVINFLFKINFDPEAIKGYTAHKFQRKLRRDEADKNYKIQKKFICFESEYYSEMKIQKAYEEFEQQEKVDDINASAREYVYYVDTFDPYFRNILKY